MSAEEITEWFNKEWWPLYPNDLSHGKKGPKTVALKSMLKLNPDDEMRQSIINKMRVLIRAGKTEKRCGKDPDRWPFASTWINQERWNGVEDMAMPSTITDARKCACGADTDIVNQCWSCHDRTDKAVTARKQMLKDKFIENGLLHDESKAERTKRCREFAVPKMARLLAQRGLGESR